MNDELGYLCITHHVLDALTVRWLAVEDELSYLSNALVPRHGRLP